MSELRVEQNSAYTHTYIQTCRPVQRSYGSELVSAALVYDRPTDWPDTHSLTHSLSVSVIQSLTLLVSQSVESVSQSVNPCAFTLSLFNTLFYPTGPFPSLAFLPSFPPTLFVLSCSNSLTHSQSASQPASQPRQPRQPRQKG